MNDGYQGNKFFPKSVTDQNNAYYPDNSNYDPNYNPNYDPNYEQNYNNGYAQNNGSYEQNYNNSYDQNYNSGYDQNYNNGYNQGYTESYDSNNNDGYYEILDESGLGTAPVASAENKGKKAILFILIFLLIAAIAFLLFVKKGDKYYSVEINADNGTEVYTTKVKKNGLLDVPDNPTKKGYIFVGWYVGEEIFSFDRPITGDILITAKWEADSGEKFETDDNKKVFVVYFDVNDGSGTVISQKIIEGGTASRPDNPIREDYVFLDWYNKGVLYDFDTPVTESVYLYAFWDIAAKAKMYTVSFDLNGGTGDVSDQMVAEGVRVTQPSNPTRNGYTFNGWFDGGTIFDFSSGIDSNLTLTAQWISNSSEDVTKYKVKFDLNGGSGSIPTQTVVAGGKVSHPADPKRSGYTFAGWYNGTKEYDFDSSVKKDLTLTAKWIKAVKYKVTFDSNGGSSVDTQTVASGGKVKQPKNPTRSGYTFAGWYKDNKIYNFNSKVTSDMTLTARWVSNSTSTKYTVTFNSNGGSSVVTQTIVSGGVAVKPPNPTRSGYTFEGWYNGGSVYNFNTPVTSNITLTAHWEQTKYTVTFNSNGGTSVPSQTVAAGGKATQPSNPTRSGYTFKGWYNGSTSFNFSTAINSNITLTAKWEALPTFTVTFNSNGGPSVPAQHVVSGGKASEPVISRTGYTFKGWYYNGAKYNFSSLITSNITLTAQWEATRFVVSFNGNGGPSPSSQTVPYGGKVSQPSTPSRAGYAFNGWYYSGSPYNFSNPVTHSFTLTAQWTQQRYTVTFDSAGGSSVSSQSIPYGGRVSQPANPTRSGYTFEGWYKGSSPYSFGSTVTSSFTLTAHWASKPVTVPTLNYTYSGSSGRWVFINNPESVTDTMLANRSDRLFYRDTFSGTMELYYTHSFAKLSTSAYYVIRFYNPGSSNVTLKINKSGASTGDNSWTQAWRNYYSGAIVTRNTLGTATSSFNIPPNSVLYFYHNGSNFIVGNGAAAEAMASKMRTGFDGVLNVTASGKLEFAALAFNSTFTETLNSSYPGNYEVYGGVNNSAVYTGYSTKLPVVTNNITFQVNEGVNTGTRLRVNYNGSTYNSWLTNGTGAYLLKQGTNLYDLMTIPETVKSDIFTFSFKGNNGSSYTAGPYPTYKDSRSVIRQQYGISSRNYNIANYGVHYNENIKIQNTGSRSRTVSFRLRNASSKMSGNGCEQTLIVISSRGNKYNRIVMGSEMIAWTVTVGPNSTVSVPTEITMGSDSCGYVEKYLLVEQ